MRKKIICVGFEDTDYMRLQPYKALVDYLDYLDNNDTVMGS